MQFKKFVETIEVFEAKKDLANYLAESDFDLYQFNKGLSVLTEWDFNPLKTMAQSGAAGAGAVAGSAFGPIGTALGGLAGRAIGKGVSNVAGKFFGKSRVQPIQPIYQQAMQAVNSLSQILNDPKSQNIGNVQSINQNLQKVQSDLKNMGNSIPEIDNQRNAKLDTELKSGGGWGEKLRGATGNDKVSKAMNFIGNKIQNIPALNQDQGLRRAMSKGMDALQTWSKENPQKAAMLNMGAAGLGAVGGAMTANQFSGLGQGEPQQSFKKDNQIANNNSGNQIANNNSGNQIANNNSGNQIATPSSSYVSPDAEEFLTLKPGHVRDDRNWRSEVGYWKPGKDNNGEDVMHSQDGNTYRMSKSKLDNELGMERFQKLDPTTGKWSRPSFNTDYTKSRVNGGWKKPQ
jgi:hypothetical protein